MTIKKQGLCKRIFAVAALGFISSFAVLAAADTGVTYLNQGKAWTEERRADYYTRDQGSQIMPLSWISALRQPNNDPFMANSLSRYGYLDNPDSIPKGLPVGFTLSNTGNGEMIGMTCAACHTRQISMKGKNYRADGGPAIVDFQSFLADLDTAVSGVLKDSASFDVFAHRVLGPTASTEEIAALHKEVEDWYASYGIMMKRSLPAKPWGPGRLDAVSMIFNRLSGLDLGDPANHYVIADNIKSADAPVRYPFLWNAPRQDWTQWPGFAENGNALLGLTRNLGEVFGVFALFHPKKDPATPLQIDYLATNSANFQGLKALESLIDKVGPPVWPLTINHKLALQGSKIFAKTCSTGCHEVKRGENRFPNFNTWATPILNVGTDVHEWEILGGTVNPGVLTGAKLLLGEPLTNPDKAFSVLGLAVGGSILQHTFQAVATFDDQQPINRANPEFARQADMLKKGFPDDKTKTTVASGSYEARVLHGIWAAAPYLHNGSVPTLADLLKPVAQRPVSFKVGPNYDPVNVGLAKEQTAFDQMINTTDCSALNSGDSRCGHEYGTTLKESEKKALLEYLKTL